MKRTILVYRSCAALLLWFSTCSVSGIFDARHCRTAIHMGVVLSSLQPDAILAAWDWGWESRLVDSALAERQRTADSCGPAALQRVFQNHEWLGPTDACRRARTRTVQRLETTLTGNGIGCTLGDLQRAAARLGLRTRLLVTDELRDITPPAILHLRRGHFVVFEERVRDCVRVFDPACGVIRTGAHRLSATWSGAALQFAGAEHNPSGLAVHP